MKVRIVRECVVWHKIYEGRSVREIERQFSRDIYNAIGVENDHRSLVAGYYRALRDVQEVVRDFKKAKLTKEGLVGHYVVIERFGLSDTWSLILDRIRSFKRI